MNAALLASLCVLPVAVLTAWATDRGCFHLEGDVEAAEPSTPRGRWCSAVEPGHHWWPLALIPPLACLLLVALTSLSARLSTTRVRIAVALLISALAVVQAVHSDELKAVNEL